MLNSTALQFRTKYCYNPGVNTDTSVLCQTGSPLIQVLNSSSQETRCRIESILNLHGSAGMLPIYRCDVKRNWCAKIGLGLPGSLQRFKDIGNLKGEGLFLACDRFRNAYIFAVIHLNEMGNSHSYTAQDWKAQYKCEQSFSANFKSTSKEYTKLTSCSSEYSISETTCYCKYAFKFQRKLILSTSTPEHYFVWRSNLTSFSQNSSSYKNITWA